MSVCVESVGRSAYLFLSQIVGKVGNHDLGSGGDAVFGRTTLLGGTRLTGSSGLAVSGGSGSGVCFVGNVGKRCITSRTSGASTTATATATATTSSTGATLLTIGAFLLVVLIGLASELDRDLAFEDIFAGEISDGLFSTLSSLQIDKGIANRTVGAGVDGDRGGLAVGMLDGFRQ
jgi:hypothetical protein